ncbi:recombinase family protein [Nonomuraea indica]|uniref:Recombinase family protein n=1 Tax=Nonomuraea indica TaxID=1581193 RepID=A0ABW8A863_9ACTN
MSCIAAALRPRRFEISHYFRLSTASRNLERQRDALKAADCRRLFADKKSGKTADRPELAARHAFLTEGDTLVVPNLNRSAPGGPPVPSNPPPRRQHPDSPGWARPAHLHHIDTQDCPPNQDHFRRQPLFLGSSTPSVCALNASGFDTPSAARRPCSRAAVYCAEVSGTTIPFSRTWSALDHDRCGRRETRFRRRIALEPARARARRCHWRGLCLV